MTGPETKEFTDPGWIQKYRLRLKRRRLLWRSIRNRHALNLISDHTRLIKPGHILCFTTLRNEIERLPWFFHHYRRLGVDHFLVVDNGSDDGSAAYLKDQPDVSLWQTDASYRDARFGLDWLTWLQMRYGHRHWTLMVDADELLVYPRHDTRSLCDLTSWLDNQNCPAFGALMLDLYPKGRLGEQAHDSEADPTETLCWFDSGPYRSRRQEPLGNLWVQGGVRARVFFADQPERAPTLNKIPLVKWNRRYAYVNSCHSILPRQLNYTYDGPFGSAPSGVLLHTKFLPQVIEKSRVEKQRRQHFHDPDQFRPYYDGIIDGPDLWTPQSERYSGWAHLQSLGLISAGKWN